MEELQVQYNSWWKEKGYTMRCNEKQALTGRHLKKNISIRTGTVETFAKSEWFLLNYYGLPDSWSLTQTNAVVKKAKIKKYILGIVDGWPTD